MKVVRTLLRVTVAALALIAASGASAQPIVYEFSGVYGNWYRDPPVYHNWYELLCGGDSCQPFSATLTYDADAGIQALDLVGEVPLAGATIQLGGTSATPGAMASSDTLALPVTLRPDTYWELSPGGQNGLVHGPYEAGFSLTAPGLISEGQLREGLTIADLVDPAFAGSYRYAEYELAPSFFSHPCYALGLSTLQCVESGYPIGSFTYGDDWYGVFAITEVHQVVPESPAALLAAVALVLGAGARSCRRSLVIDPG